MTPILDVSNLGIRFGGLQALDDFNVKIAENEIVGLIGPNGAGKTTVFNLLTNVYAPTTGTITVDGSNTVGKSVHSVTKVGIARTFQNIRLFGDMSVIDNVKVGMHHNAKYSAIEAILRLPSYWKQEKQMTDKAMELLSVLDLDSLAYAQAGSLPYGAQRRLEIIRAIATEPKVLLLDEPAAGMNPSETLELMNNIRKIRDHFNISIFLIEHDMNLVMGVCDRILVLNYGLIIASGTPNEIKNNPDVIEAYLGQQRSE